MRTHERWHHQFESIEEAQKFTGWLYGADITDCYVDGATVSVPMRFKRGADAVFAEYFRKP